MFHISELQVEILLELKPEEEYTLLYKLETKLRLLIEKELSALSEYWWDERVPWKVRNRVVRRMKSGKIAPWMKVGIVKLPQTYYLGISDYIEIITQPNNWKRVFEKIFRQQDFIRGRLETLKSLRDKVMHFQPLKPKEKDLLKKYVEEILGRIGNWETINSRYVDTARESFLRGETKKALKILNEGLKQTITDENPRGDPWLAFWMGWMLEELRKYDEAESWYRYSSERLLPQYRKMAEERLLNIKEKRNIEVVCPNCKHKFKIDISLK